TQARTLLRVDQEFAAKVQLWERRLGELYQMAEPVEPAPEIWTRIKAKLVKPRPNIIVLLIASLVIGALVAIYYLPQWQQTQAASKGGRRDLVPVLATAARTADVPVYLDAVGTAKALNTVMVRSQVDGKITEISFTEGQDVPKGYVLAKIDPVTYQAAFDQTVAKKAQDEVQLANAKLDLERYIRLASSNAVNKQQLDTQKALVGQLEA